MLSWRALPKREGAEAGVFLTVESLQRFGIHVAFTTRLGGFSIDPWSSLNLSYVSGDDPAIVRQNRDRAMEAVHCTSTDWTAAKQVHGTNVVHVNAQDRGRGAESPQTTFPDADALVTDEAGIGLAVLTADCVPLFLADPARRRIAVVHAGWRGMLGGIVERAAEHFEDASRIVAVAGPSIGPCCYQVGAEVSDLAADRFGSAVMRSGNLDLWAASVASARDAGIFQIDVAGVCTRCESHRFYSHRAGDSGRQGVLACLS